MHLRLSRFIHLLPIGDNRVLLVDAIGHARVPVSTELAAIAAKPCRSWRRESVRAENFGLRVRESI